jgi:hypothetical protein
MQVAGFHQEGEGMVEVVKMMVITAKRRVNVATGMVTIANGMVKWRTGSNTGEREVILAI